jgi:hypothetical protein
MKQRKLLSSLFGGRNAARRASPKPSDLHQVNPETSSDGSTAHSALQDAQTPRTSMSHDPLQDSGVQRLFSDWTNAQSGAFGSQPGSLQAGTAAKLEPSRSAGVRCARSHTVDGSSDVNGKKLYCTGRAAVEAHLASFMPQPGMHAPDWTLLSCIPLHTVCR